MEEDVKELGRKVEWLERQVRFYKRMREEDRKNSGTKREGFMGPQWQDVACPPATELHLDAVPGLTH